MASAATIALPNGVKLSCKATGAPLGAVVVLLPGPTDSWRSYSPVLDLLPSSIRAIAVSQRGHGTSDKPASGYGVEDFAADVVMLLDELGVARAVLAGHSGSCLTARRVAIDHPDRVAGLILEASPVSLKGHTALEAFVNRVVSNLQDPIGAEFARSVVTDTSSESLSPELLDDLVNELLLVPARVWKEMFARLLTYDDRSELGTVDASTMLLWGDGDGIVDRDMQETLTELIPDAELRVYEGVGHTPRWEDPERFSGDLAEFVERSFLS